MVWLQKGCLLAFWLAASDTSLVFAEQNCERLKATLTYTQEKAPRDLSTVLPVVVEKVNRVLDGVVDVEVEWTGADLHGRVGERFVKSTVTRLASAVASDNLLVSVDQYGREVTTQCFHVPFTILDTNECTLPKDHPMSHQCPPPSICVNTIGAYECMCPRISDSPTTTFDGNTADDKFWTTLNNQSERTPWELSFALATQSSCPSSPSTHGCCPDNAHSPEGQKCRARFTCPTNPCGASTSNAIMNDCADNADCVRSEKPTDSPNYTCQCPEGLMGNGRLCQEGIDPKPEPKVMFDGKTPTELTIKNNYYCGCTKPEVDACSGFPPCKEKHQVCTVGPGNQPMCACKPGYVFHETYGCVDENPPTLKLRHDPNNDKTLRLKQGDEYREYLVDIVDDNAEEYMRSLKVSYSQPLPPGCLTQVGEFHVNYTVAMPWAKVPHVRVTRRVIIEDIDECSLNVAKYQQACPALVPQCDVKAGAKCVNTNGSYECHCPSKSTGDGFLKSATFGDLPPPDSYEGGTSCVDTSKPIITLQGPNPKVFKICECGGLVGVMNYGDGDGDDKDLHNQQRQLYEEDIKKMVMESAGAELCASPSNPNPKPSDCVRAVDHTYKGEVDLSDRVIVGEPQRKSALQWVVPYNVKDDAGNEAVTVWREVVVQEVDLATVENVIRAEVTKEKELEQQKAIQKAIREEKAKWERENVNANRKRPGSSSRTCPACPACECPNVPQTTKEDCQQFCEGISRSCSLRDDNVIYAMLFWLESFFPEKGAPLVLLVAITFCVAVVLRNLTFGIFNPKGYQDRHYANNDQIDDAAILNSPRATIPARTPAPPPRQSITTMTTTENVDPLRSSLSPPGFASPTDATNGSIQSRTSRSHYEDGIITPSRLGDGANRRRNLYSS